ncbi:MAG: DinB family protein [Desulfovibrio sp.]|nr:DinB family protein [Desulfovibrio sp.]MBI4961391.1 DinB family protein [Desulfovibrio sp.]
MIDLDKATLAVAGFQALLDRTPPEAVNVRVYSEAWTLSEIVGHLIDSASNNHQRFARLRLGNLDGFPGYEAETWVRAQDHDSCPFPLLSRLWTAYNGFLLHLAETIPQAALQNAWMKPEGPLTLGFLVNDYFSHLNLHAEHYAKRLDEVEAARARG